MSNISRVIVLFAFCFYSLSTASVSYFEETLPNNKELRKSRIGSAFLRGPDVFKKVLETANLNYIFSLPLYKETRSNCDTRIDIYANSFITIATIKRDYGMIKLLLDFGAYYDFVQFEHDSEKVEYRNTYSTFKRENLESRHSYSAFEIAAIRCDVKALEMFLDASKLKSKTLPENVLRLAHGNCCYEFLWKLASLGPEDKRRIVPRRAARFISVLDNLTLISHRCGWKTARKLIESGFFDFSPSKNTGNTILHVLAMKGNMEGINYLFKNGYIVLREWKRGTSDPNVVNLEKRNVNGQTALHLAIKEANSSEMVSLLIYIGAKVTSVDNNNANVFKYAVRSNNCDIVDILLEHGVHPNSGNSANWRALFFAVERGNFKMVDLLLEHGAEVKSLDMNGLNILQRAAKLPFLDVKMISKLVTVSGGANFVNKNGDTALDIAIRSMNWKVVDYLVNCGAKARFYVPFLHVAVSQFAYSSVRNAIANGANINEIDENGDSLLHVAAHTHNSDNLVTLIRLGANVNAVNLQKQTPYHYAVQKNDLVAVRTLVKRGADIHACDVDNRNALHYALAPNSAKGVIEYLLSIGVNVNHLDNSGVPVSIQAFKADKEKFRVLVGMDIYGNPNTKVDLEAVDNTGKTILLHAIIAHENQLVVWILQRNVNLEIRDKNGFNTLITACSVGNLEIVKILLNLFKVDPNSVDNAGKPALFHAIDSESVDIVRILIKRGAKAGKKVNNMDAIQYARACYKASKKIRSILLAAIRYENLISLFRLE